MTSNNLKASLFIGTSLSMLAGCSGEEEVNDAVEKPNIVYIVIDDMGYGDLGVYGSSINTPNIDELAKNGLQYINYFTSPLSSPSRASLLTGSEANKIGMGVVSDVDLGERVPNIHGRIYPEYAPVTHTLKENGYTTIATGKWHLGPYEEFRPNGDKYHWPSGKGFDENYSFIASQVNQFEPGGIIEGNEYVIPDTSKEDYHLTKDIFNKTLEYIDEVDKNEPFFAYIGLGAMHGPFNVAKEYIDAYKGKFDHGWDTEREMILARQIELGIMPEGTKVPPRDKSVAAWNELSEKEKAVAARHMETYAGFLEYTDKEIGKFIAELKERDEYDNTIFIFVSDNGANYNGGPTGSLMAHANENLFVHDTDTQYSLMENFGNKLYGTQYNIGWAMTSNTPFRYYKTKAHYGGVKTAFIASWVNGIKNPGRLVDEMVAVFDISPTILDVINAKHLETVNGIKQEPMQGISFKESFESDKPMVNSRKKIALMMLLDRMYADGSGYMIVTNPYSQEWELYNIKNDPTQVNNLAKNMPDILQKMVNEYNTKERREFNNSENLFMDIVQGVDKKIIVERYGQVAIDVFNTIENGVAPTEEASEYIKILKFLSFVPDDIGYAGVGTIWYRSPESPLSKKEYVYTKEEGHFFSLVVPNIAVVSHNVYTEIEVPENPSGVIFANGGIDGGYVLYIKDKKLVYEYNYLGEKQKVVSTKDITKGKHHIEIEYNKKTMSSGDINLLVDGEIVGSKESLKTLSTMLSYDYFSMGSDVGSKVSSDYTDDFEFNGKVSRVKMNLKDDLLAF